MAKRSGGFDLSGDGKGVNEPFGHSCDARAAPDLLGLTEALSQSARRSCRLTARGEALAGVLRPGNAGTTADDHFDVF